MKNLELKLILKKYKRSDRKEVNLDQGEINIQDSNQNRLSDLEEKIHQLQENSRFFYRIELQ